MSQIPELLSLLCLDPRQSYSPFGGQHRSILISKDYTNTGDFVLNSLIQYFSRKDRKTPNLLVTLSHDWMNYLACAAKCGFNIRRSTNGGNIHVLNVMNKIYQAYSDGDEDFDICDYILTEIFSFVDKLKPLGLSDQGTPPVVIIIDDITILLGLGCSINRVYWLINQIDTRMRQRSRLMDEEIFSHLILQMVHFDDSSPDKLEETEYLMSNLANTSDLSIDLRPLDTGFSTRVDGTIKIIDNRIPLGAQLPALNRDDGSSFEIKLFPSSGNIGEVGTKKAYFFKLSDRRVRLTSSAHLFSA